MTILCVSCAKEGPCGMQEENLQEMTFSAVSSDGTRTSFNGTDIVWKSGESLSVFDSAFKNRRFTTSGSGVSASFTGRAKESSTYYAIYPYMAENAMTSAGRTSVVIPTRQKAVPGAWADSVNCSMGKISGAVSGNVFSMKNIGGYIKVVVPEGEKEIVSMTLRAPAGENVSGPADVDYTGDVPVATPGKGGSSSISLVPDGAAFAPGTYYAVAIPCILSGGLELSMRRSDDRTAVLTNETPAIVRNSAKSSSFSIESSSLVWEEPVQDSITVAFLNAGLSISQPFTENMPAVGSPSGSRVEETYYLKDYGYPFFFSATHFTINTTTGLRMGTTGDYVLLPSIPGKRLIRVSMEFGLNSVTASYTAGIYTDSNPSVPVAGGEDIETGTEAQGKVLTWNLTGTAEGECYRLRRGTGGTAFRIRNITLIYSGHHVAEVTGVSVTESSLESGTGTVKGKVTAMHPEAGVISWGVEYRRQAATQWTAGPTGEGLTVDATIPGLDNDTWYARIWARAGFAPAVYSEEFKLLSAGPLVISMLPFNALYWTWSGDGSVAFPTADSKKTTSDQKVWDNWKLRGQYDSGFYPWNLNNKTPLYAYDYWGDDEGRMHISSRGIVKLPAIPQYRLVKVTVTCAQSTQVELSICSSTTSIKINGADIRTKSNQGVQIVWDLTTLATPTIANTNYYLADNSSGKELILQEFTLTYDPAQ